jgi:hypothetical protein
MSLDKRNPLGIGDERASENQALGGADVQQNSQIARNLQVVHIQRRFLISKHLAVVVAELAFTDHRRAAA